ncbi:GGDEF domain-containing protein [Accumulibacter sp.]|uniref:GGDEF domain-containing protein n=1 Tax=Accumulibacter sp. TaxID=2053492 RepID=UPI0025F7F8F0|nr:GGDEF domain-containing protein [Accumulibacter sp.]MCM8594346.1 GGDEF domain-containing protein [Accumulibacter sp.]MCM8625019.1 GGDEF domain-containing protein [Accumulibacter sp.]MDS4048490.1 GGDEF domain-containing protein [Accumulibacter sp.]
MAFPVPAARPRQPRAGTPETGAERALLELLDAEARIADLERALGEARAAALTDALTGAYNRRGLADAYQREAARMQRHGRAMALALIDLDDFKRINDTLGHDAGDQALIHLVGVLRSTLRPSDLLCRFGGEEFAVLLPETSLAEAAAAITRSQQQLGTHPLPDAGLVLRFSAGVVSARPGESLEQAIARADCATYAAKRAGKNRVVQG